MRLLEKFLPGTVEVQYVGRLGNQLAQYCLGRSIATQLGFCLFADPLPGFPNTCQWGQPGWRALPGLEVQRQTNRHRIDLPGMLADRRPRRSSCAVPSSGTNTTGPTGKSSGATGWRQLRPARTASNRTT